MAALAVLAGLACTNNADREFDATLNGIEEVPPVATSSEALATFKLSPDNSSMTFELQVTSSIDSASGAQIRLAGPGKNGPVIVTLWAGLKGRGFTGWFATGTITSPDLMGPMSAQTVAALADSMRRGVTYVSIHSLQFPGGHVRGQIHEKE